MKNNIYLIEPTKQGEEYISYDCYTGFVVIAENEEQARELCPHADEGNIWISHKLVECKKIGTSNGKIGVVLSSFNAG
jgi:hypothetical protein